MKLLRLGDTGSLVQLLQLGLTRAGFPAKTDGIYGQGTRRAVMDFQRARGLSPDGIAGSRTQLALQPFYTGYTTHIVRPGDSLYSIATMHNTTVDAIKNANPGISIMNLPVGAVVTVPLAFNVVPTTIDYSSALIAYCVRGLAARYPFITTGEIGRSVMGKPLWFLRVGNGENRVFYNASHHSNEWITTPVLLKFCEELCRAASVGGDIFGQSGAEILKAASIYIAPAVNPDAIDLVTGALSSGAYYDNARRIAADYPQIPFPGGWKANIRGIDLNLQYPAGWEQARENKFALGFTTPAPGDYVGRAPLSAQESRAMYDFTLSLDPALTLSYHTQGEVIYWKYLDYEPKDSRKIAETFGAVSGYAVEDTPYAAGFAGYKDWFIEHFYRPGYTIECGIGINPLAISQFDRIYSDNIGILTLGAIITA